MSWGRALALAIGAGHVATIFALGIPPTLGLYQAAVIVVAELLIWFPDRLGPLSGVRFEDGPTLGPAVPGCAVAAAGWLMLAPPRCFH